MITPWSAGVSTGYRCELFPRFQWNVLPNNGFDNDAISPWSAGTKTTATSQNSRSAYLALAAAATSSMTLDLSPFASVVDLGTTEISIGGFAYGSTASITLVFLSAASATLKTVSGAAHGTNSWMEYQTGTGAPSGTRSVTVTLNAGSSASRFEELHLDMGTIPFHMASNGNKGVVFTLTGSKGFIGDGPDGYPSAGSGNILWSWLIAPTFGGGSGLIKVTSDIDPSATTRTDFDTEANYDYVRVYDGSSSSNTLLGQYSGTSTALWTLSSTGSTSLVVFNSDPATVGTGFTIRYWAKAYPVLTTLSTPAWSTAFTITGTNLMYDAVQSDLTVTVGGVACPITSASNTQIVCTFPASSAGLATNTAYPVRVTNEWVQDQSGRTATVVSNPTLSGVSPSLGASGTVLTLTGTFFSTTVGSYSVTVGGFGCPVGTLTGSTQVTCTAPAGPSAGNALVVVTVSGIGSTPDLRYFQYAAAPVLSAITPTAEGQAGVTVTLGGSGFGTLAADLRVFFGASQVSAGTIAGVTDTSFTVTVPAGTLPSTVGVYVTRFTTLSSGTVSFDYIATPTITAITPAGATVGAQITLTGTGFGTAVGALSVFVGTAACTGLAFSGANLVCTVPSLAPASYNVKVRRSQIDSVVFAFSVISAITVSSVSPVGGAAGATVTVGGTGFDSVQIAVTVGGAACTSVAVASATSLTCVTSAALAQGAAAIAVSRFSGTTASTGSVSFNVVAPRLNGAPALTPTGGAPNTVITVSGQLGTVLALGYVQVTVGGLVCTSLTAVSLSTTSTLTCVVPTLGAAGAAAVVVTHHNVPTPDSVLFTFFLAPAVTGVTPNPATVGSVLNLAGTSLGPSGEGQVVTLTQGATSVAVTPFTVVTANTLITCTMPSGFVDGTVSATVRRFTTTSTAGSFSLLTTPVVSSVSSTAVEPKGGDVLTISGTLGTTCVESQYSATVGGVACPIVAGSLSGCASIRCTLPAGAAGSSAAVVVTRSSLFVSNNNVLFSYPTPPTVSSVAPTSGLAGAVVTVTGTQFGTNITALAVTVGGAACAVVPGSLSGTTTTTVQCTVSSGLTSGAQAVVVLRRGVASTQSVAYTVTGRPVVTSVTPTGGKAGDVITLAGSGLGTGSEVTAVTVAGTSCPVVARAADGSQVTCTLPSVAVGVQPVLVTRDAIADQSSRTIKVVVAFSLASLSPANGQAGTVVTITGSGSFGGTTALVASDVTVMVGSTAVAVTSLPTASTAVVTMPSSAAGTAAVGVVLFGAAWASTNTVSFTYLNTPTISSVVPPGGRTGSTITVNGGAFGSEALLSCTVGGLPCLVVPGSLNAAATQFQCVLPTKTAGFYTVSVVVGGSATAPQTPSIEYANSPTVSSVTPRGGQAGQVVTLGGSGFGTDATYFAATIGGFACPLVAGSLNDTSARCTAPAGFTSESGAAVAVARLGVGSNSPATFTYIPVPWVFGTTPQGGQSQVVTVVGAFFGAAEGDLAVTVGGQPCPIVAGSLQTASQLQCTTPVLAPAVADVVVRRFLVSSAAWSGFEYVVAPTVTVVAPAGTAPGRTLTVTGTGFGSVESDLVVTVGGQPCVLLGGSLVSGSSLQCTAPTLVTGVSYPVAVARLLVGASATVSVLYVDVPALTALTPAGGLAGTTLTLTGTGLGTNETQLAVTLGGLPCPIVPGSLNGTSVRCVAPANVIGLQAAAATRFLEASGASPTAVFEYINTPQLTRVSPAGGRAVAAPALLLTISGSGFGSNPGTVAVTVGGQSCAIAALNAAGTEVVCTAPVLSAGPQAVALSRYGVAAPAPLSFLQIGVPTVGSSTPAGGQQTARLTVSGTGFGTDSTTFSVLVGGNICPIQAGTLSDTGVECIVPAGQLGAATVSVVRLGVASTSVGTFVYVAQPTVAAVSPAGGQDGVVLTVQGTGFGTVVGDVVLTVGGAVAVVNTLSDTTALVVVPSSLTPGLHEVLVSRFGISSLNSVVRIYYQYIPTPAVTSVALAGGEGGDLITVTGTDFGSSETTTVVTVGGVAAQVQPGTLSAVGTSVVVAVPLGLAAGPQAVVVTRFGVASNSDVAFEVLDAPVISSVAPVAGLSGSLITLSGSGFGAAAGDLAVAVGGVACGIVSVQDSEVVCTVPTLTQGRKEVTVRRFTVDAAAAGSFLVVYQPFLTSVSPVGGTDGTFLTLSGINFGGTVAQVRVTVGGLGCSVIPASLNLQSTSVVCIAPPLAVGDTPGDRAVVVSYYGIASTDAVSFKYVPRPVLDLIFPRGGESGQVVTIYGSNLGETQAAMLVTVNAIGCELREASLSNTPVAPPSYVGVLPSTQSIECTVPRQSLGVVPVGLSNYGVSALQTLTFEYLLAPSVTGVEPRGGVVGDLVTITGAFFGSSSVDFSVRMGSEPCTIVSFSNTTSEVVVVVPQLSNDVLYHVRVKTLAVFESRETSADQFLVVNAPVIAAVVPTGATNNTKITLQGSNFFLGSDKSQVEIRVGNATCTQPELVGLTGTTITCLVSSQEAGLKNVSLTRFGHLVAYAPELLPMVAQPTLAGVSPRGGSPGTVVTVKGTGFGDTDMVVQLQSPQGPQACEVVPGSLQADPTLGPLGASIECVVSGNFSLGSAREALLTVRVCRFGSICNPAANAVSFILVVAAPDLLRLVPRSEDQALPGNSVAAAVGDTLRLSVVGAGSQIEDLVVLVGSDVCNITELNAAGTEVACTLPAPTGVGSVFPVHLERFGMPSNSISFTYILTPVIETVNPPGGRAGDVVTITGRNFGDSSTATHTSVTVGSKDCRIETLNATYITCTVQGGYVGTQNVTIQRYETESEPSSFLFLELPRVTSVQPRGGFGGTVVTVTGRNLGFDASTFLLGKEEGAAGKTPQAVLDTIARITKIKIGARECALVDVHFEAATSDCVLTCVTPTLDKSDFGEKPVVVTVYSSSSVAPFPTFFYLVESELYFVRFDSPEGIAFEFFVAVTMLAVLAVSAIFLKHNNAPVIKAASPLFCQLVLMGLMLDLVGILTQYDRPTDTLCLARAWVPSVAFTIFLSNLFVKTWRIWRIFDNKRMKRVVITNGNLLTMFGFFLLVDVAILGVWTGTNAPAPAIVYGNPSAWTCQSSQSDIFELALRGYKYVLLLFGTFLAINIRNIQVSQFNESRHIAFSIYNILIILTLILIVVSSLSDQKSIFIVSSMGELLIIWGILATLFLPKLFVIFSPGDFASEDASRTHISNGGSQYRGTMSGSISGTVAGPGGLIGMSTMSGNAPLMTMVGTVSGDGMATGQVDTRAPQLAFQ
eukprot:TRINITY_DN9_c0_g1_i4.p1 TRINITY_DN9_c0_g1~~TRINITY_DN9_c0_g1_i4.p1  ORF type:complete len:3547 (-),score=946.75 TRINITY_DN9_c0_g1_i4:148-9951(-)